LLSRVAAIVLVVLALAASAVPRDTIARTIGTAQPVMDCSSGSVQPVLSASPVLTEEPCEALVAQGITAPGICATRSGGRRLRQTRRDSADLEASPARAPPYR